jgi:hypothetical protein
MSGAPKSTPPSRPDLSGQALRIATTMFFACLATMLVLVFEGSADGFAADLFDTCRTLMIASVTAVLALLGYRRRG